MQTTVDQETSPIRVTIKTSISDVKEDGSQGPDSESATSSEGQDFSTEQDWEQAPIRKHLVPKPKWVLLEKKATLFTPF